ncbi:hypothetical protein [Nocardia fluminea]|uniref:hypothetical protein n=1 Tax=Nocardia fluminea TaxID=134984 RepID=UPI00365A6DE9
MIALAFAVADEGLRILFFTGACFMAAAVVLVLPAHWRKRLGPPTAVFIAAASALSVFLVKPQDGPPEPQVDAREMATYVAMGPFDQELPVQLQAGKIQNIQISDPSATQRLAAVHVPIADPRGKMSAYGVVEVYPTVETAIERGTAELERWRAAAGKYAPKGKTIDGFCFEILSPSHFICGVARGRAFVETTFTPPSNATRGVAQQITESLADYAANKEKLATE